MSDQFGREYIVSYMKTREGKEVDFVMVNQNNIPEKLYEVKLSNTSVSKQLEYFSEKYNIPAVQLVKNITTEYVSSPNIEVRNLEKYLSLMK